MNKQRQLILLGLLASLTACGGGSGSGTTTTTNTNTDTTAPQVTITAASQSVVEGQTTTITATSNEGLTPTVSCDNNATVSGSTFTAPMVDQDTNVTCTATATDAANNTGRATVSITVPNQTSGGSGTTNPNTTLSAAFPKQVNVFGIWVMATNDVPDNKVLHAANVMAEYLDNDEDGTPDIQAVVDIMVQRNATLVMSNTEASFPQNVQQSDDFQNLFGEETRPNGRAQGQFDATLEEVLHLISHVGYSRWKPTVFGETTGTQLTQAMDVARGGQFTTIPNPYPAGAWYTYNDQTCTYSCMATEYFYWALTSMLGAQDFSGRLAAIQNEWQLNTRALVQSRDSAIFTLLTDPTHMLPTNLPQGNYTGGTLNLVRSN